jgi:hypothetical protein
VDVYANPDFVPYATVHSQGEFDKPSGTSSQCVPNNFTATYSDPNCTIPKLIPPV